MEKVKKLFCPCLFEICNIWQPSKIPKKAGNDRLVILKVCHSKYGRIEKLYIHRIMNICCNYLCICSLCISSVHVFCTYFWTVTSWLCKRNMLHYGAKIYFYLYYICLSDNQPLSNHLVFILDSKKSKNVLFFSIFFFFYSPPSPQSKDKFGLILILYTVVL